MTRYVDDFTEGDRTTAALLGGKGFDLKGFDLAEVTRMGLRVPPGFTLTTVRPRGAGSFLATGRPPAQLDQEIAAHIWHPWKNPPALRQATWSGGQPAAA